MDGGGVFVLFVLIFGVLAMIPASIAASKGRSLLAWWFYGFLFFPIALIHSMFLKPTGAAVDELAVAAGNLKCPHCAEWIRREAKVCRFCGRDVEPVGA